MLEMKLHTLFFLYSFLTVALSPLPNREERASQPSIDTFLDKVSGLLHGLQRFAQDHDLGRLDELSPADLNTLEQMWDTLQTVRRHFENIQVARVMGADLSRPVEETLQKICHFLRNIRDSIQRNTQDQHVATLPTHACTNSYRVPSGGRGATHFDIRKEQLEILLSLKMSLSEIAKSGILGTRCRSTLYNHCRRLGVSLPRERFSNVSNEELAQTVREIHDQQPRSGSEEVRATLRTSRGMTVQRRRVRESLRVADPIGTACRWAQVTQRRSYSVKSPNSLWHLDNNHALKRWGFYVHGGIDGFSRTITFLRISNSLSGRTALQCFLRGIEKWGLPSRIRLDGGQEYNECHRFMEWQMGTGRGSALRGKSVHNQRIERLWRDVYTKVLDLFYGLFFHLEDNQALDVNNPNHMFALGYTFLPRIQESLDRWATAHNNHGVRTENHRTPYQMWLGAMVNQRCSLQAATHLTSPSVAVRNVVDFNFQNHSEEIFHRFGIDFSNNTLHELRNMMEHPLTDEEIDDLRQRIDPLRHSDVHGLDVYRDVINYINNIMHRDH